MGVTVEMIAEDKAIEIVENLLIEGSNTAFTSRMTELDESTIEQLKEELN